MNIQSEGSQPEGSILVTKENPRADLDEGDIFDLWGLEGEWGECLYSKGKIVHVAPWARTLSGLRPKGVWAYLLFKCT
eukprot:5588264-Karenia_brevis.AAC.1